MNTILIKGADFSEARVGKLNLQKIDIVKGGNGIITGVAADGTPTILHITESGYDFDKNCAYSAPIVIPFGVIGVMGKIAGYYSNTDVEKILQSTNDNVSMEMAYTFVPQGNDTNGVTSYTNIRRIYKQKAKYSVAGYKRNIGGNQRFTGVLFDGEIMNAGYLNYYTDGISTPVYFNWIRNDSGEAKEIGLAVPELYWILDA